VLILDEAHGIENVATEFFSTVVSSRRVDRLVSDTAKTLNAAKLKGYPGENRRDKLGANVLSNSRQFFDKFVRPQGRERLIPEELGSDVVTAYHRFDSALDALESSLRALEGRDEAVDHVTGRFEEIRNDLAEIVTESSSGFVHWVENRRRTIAVGASPIDVSEPLREGIFFSIPSVVLTSATLSTGGDFRFLKGRLGIDFDTVELTAPSPFDYTRQACLLVPSGLPDPRADDFVDRAADMALELIDITNGGALILSTSYRNMTALHKLFKKRVKGNLLLQGEAPKNVLLDDFRADRTSVLVATTSFWQGVDLPGETLRLVIIDKLPFAAPTDPLEAARIAQLNESGKNAFLEYQVPAAALALKQGFGRLIRTRHDRGIVAILDSRLITKRYASVFWRSLPGCPRFFQLEAVKSWWSDRR
jgi:ATP-dependent DNA helicase DinG